MSRAALVLLLLLSLSCCLHCGQSRLTPRSPHDSYAPTSTIHAHKHGSPADVRLSSPPVYLNDFIGDESAAMEASRVHLPGYEADSFAGYITIDKTYNTNTFFWFFPSQNGNPDAPLFAWFQGGPGATSMYGLFNEMGPFSVSPDGSTLIPRNCTWNLNYHMIFIDNPPGQTHTYTANVEVCSAQRRAAMQQHDNNRTSSNPCPVRSLFVLSFSLGAGFSYTEDPAGFATDMIDVGRDVWRFFVTFLSVYTSYKLNPLYITGESYAGKYVPAISHYIHLQNQQPDPPLKINLVGLTIGDGLMDPITQVPGYGDLLFNEGMANTNQYIYWSEQEARIRSYLANNDTHNAFLIFDYLLNGDFYPYPTYYFNTTGLTNYFNFMQPDYPANGWETYINLNSTRQAIHVGDRTYWTYNATVELYLISDWFRSVASMLPVLLDNYQVLIYNGQLDVILSAVQCQRFLYTLEWSQSQPWRDSARRVWKVNAADTQPAGYWQSYGRFTYVVVRGAGHLLPQDQPVRALDMITRWVQGRGAD